MKARTYFFSFFILSQLLGATQMAFAQEKKLMIQFDKGNKIQYGKFGKDSLTLILQIRKENEIFPSSFFLKGRLLGDKSVEVKIPDSLKTENSTWSFSEYIVTADNSNMYIEAKEYATFAYKPFEYSFKTTPPNATIYMIPLSEWKVLFNREDIGFEFKNSDLPMIAKYKILVPSPCTYTIFEQPYVGVFISNSKIKMEIIRPKRFDPIHNIADINFNN